MEEQSWTKLLGWPGYQVYRVEIKEEAKRLRLWVRRKKTNLHLLCSGCGEKLRHQAIHDVQQREVRDLPCFEYTTTVVVETYRVRCPDCGVKAERLPHLPSKAPFSKRFEDIVGRACESSSARQVARQFGLAESTVRVIDQRYLERWAKSRLQPALRQMGVDEIYLGKKQKFLTVVCNLETGEPVWFGAERKKETLDSFFQQHLSAFQRKRIQVACVDMWTPFRLSIEQNAPGCAIVYDKFHILQHANQAIDEVRRAEFFRQGKQMRDLVKGKRWLLLSRWDNLKPDKQQSLQALFAINEKLLKAYLLKESLEQLWLYRYEGAMLNYLKGWIDQIDEQQLAPFAKLSNMILDHVDGILNYCKVKPPLGVVEAINGNIKALLRRGRGYTNLRYLLLKAQRIAFTNTQFLVFRKAA
jgi:transposase